MKCTFYRPTSFNFDEWENIRDKMKYDLTLLKEDAAESLSLRCYLERLLPQAETLEGTCGMRFFGLGDPRAMPGDNRVEFFYWPTYIATTFCMKAVLLFPEVIDMIGEDMASINGEDALRILSECMRGCTGRGFAGHGFDDVRSLIDTMDFFTKHRVHEFIAKYPELCPEFNDCFSKAIDYLKTRVKNGEVTGDFGDNQTERAKLILGRL